MPVDAIPLVTGLLVFIASLISLRLGISVAIIEIAASLFSHYLFGHSKIKNKVVESEIKYLFLLLLTLVYFARLGNGHVVLPAFVLGLCMSRYFGKDSEHHLVIKRLRTVSYALVTPLFFIVGGLRISYSMIAAGIGLFLLLFFVKIAAKFLGVYFLAKGDPLYR